MAVVDTGSGAGGGKGKPLNVEYNLVPFIDLLSCLIAFLLMTAVWTQISMIQTNEGTSEAPNQKKDFVLALYIFNTHQDLSVGENRTVHIPKVRKQYNFARLSQELLALKSRHPKKQDILILAQDKIKYQDLVASMDTCIAADIPYITVSGMIE